MRHVIVFAEGQTEERFIKELVAPSLYHINIYVLPQLLNTSKSSKGGAVSFDRLKFNARNTLRSRQDVILSTFLDLYALETDFPGFEAAKLKADVYDRVETLEQALRDEIVDYVGCRQERFVPHIQPYEFEGLLFSDVSKLVEVEVGWAAKINNLEGIRNDVPNPEHINDGYETKPSKRLENLLTPRYRKTTHGPRAAQKISLTVIENECPHFKNWMDSLRQLAN